MADQDMSQSEIGAVMGNLEVSLATNKIFELKEINEEFYRSYSRHYFQHAMYAALSVLSDQKKALAPLMEGVNLTDEVSNTLVLRISDEDLPDDDITRSMKVQIGNIYFHALETLVRLFLAHCRNVLDSPWFALTRETSFQVFKEKRVKPLADLTGPWTPGEPWDEDIRYVLAPWPEPDENQVGYLTRAKAWMAFAAKELVDTTSYNAFKHGLAVTGGDELISFFSGDQDPRQDETATPFLHAEGDALVALERKKQPDGTFEWIRNMRYLRLNDRVGIINTAQRMIETILLIGEARFASKEITDEKFWLPHFDPTEFLKASRRDKQDRQKLQGLSMEGASFSLGFVDPAKAHPSKKKKKK